MTFVAFGPSAGGWWHLAPSTRSLTGIGHDRTVMRRLAKRVGAPVLSSTVFDSEVGMLSAAGGTEFETLATGEWMGRHVGRARCKAAVWHALAGSEEGAKRVGKALRAAPMPEDGVAAALELLGVGGLDHWGSWRRGDPAGAVTVREVPRPAAWEQPFEITVGSPAGSSGVSAVQGNAAEATLTVWCRGSQPGRVVVTLSGPAVEQGLLSGVSGIRNITRPHDLAEVDSMVVSFGEVVPEAHLEVRFAFDTRTAFASWVAATAVDQVTGASDRVNVPIAVRARSADGRTRSRSVRNDWLSVRFRPGNHDTLAWDLLTRWLSAPGITYSPDDTLEVLLGKAQQSPSVRRFRMAEIGTGRRWGRLASELDCLTSLSASPSAHAFIPTEGWTGFSYERRARFGDDAAVYTPHLELQLDRAFSADLDAVDLATVAAAQHVDALVREGHVVQAVMGRSGRNSNDFYGGRGGPVHADVAWSTTYLWSLGAHIWLGPELASRRPVDSDFSGIAHVTPLGGGCRIDNIDGHDLARLAPLLAPLREP